MYFILMKKYQNAPIYSFCVMYFIGNDSVHRLHVKSSLFFIIRMSNSGTYLQPSPWKQRLHSIHHSIIIGKLIKIVNVFVTRISRSSHPIMRYVNDTNLIQIVSKFYWCHRDICHNWSQITFSTFITYMCMSM